MGRHRRLTPDCIAALGSQRAFVGNSTASASELEETWTAAAESDDGHRQAKGALSRDALN